MIRSKSRDAAAIEMMNRFVSSAAVSASKRLRNLYPAASGNIMRHRKEASLEQERRERALDETIAETFPCSDPLSSIPDPRYAFEPAYAVEPAHAVAETHSLPESRNKIQSVPPAAPRRVAS